MILPSDIEIEKSVLGELISNYRNIYTVKAILKPECFYDPSNRKVFSSMLSIISENKPFDLLILTNKIKNDGKLKDIGGPHYLSSLLGRAVGTPNLSHHCMVLAELNLQRCMIDVSVKIQKETIEGGDIVSLLSQAREAISDLSSVEISASKHITCNMEMSSNTTVLSLNGRRITSVGNIGVLVAPPGSGKTQVCGAICASIVNPQSDCFGFEISGGGDVLYVDTELSWDDAIKNIHRIKSRCDVLSNPAMMDGSGVLKGLRYENFRGISSLGERKAVLESMIRKGNQGRPYRLVIIDGVADFVADVNDTKEGPGFIAHLIALSNQLGFGIFCTIHDNPASNKNQSKGKARGTLGSELGRKAESMMMLTKHPEDKSVRVLTFGFDYGKVRNDSDDQRDVMIQWNSDRHMMVTVDDIISTLDNVKKNNMEDSFVQAFGTKEIMRRSELEKQYAAVIGKAQSTASRHIGEALDEGILIKNESSGVYKLTKKIEADDLPF